MSLNNSNLAIDMESTAENEINKKISIKVLNFDKSKNIKKYISIKRILDVVISIISIILLFPVFLIIGIIIKTDSKGPVFFAHQRIGKNGEEFKLYKFRTMYNNAEDMIKKFTPEQTKEWKEHYKLTDDPRITKVGKFLRESSLDELPQIFNIFKGDLSLIGPRPVIKDELEKYEKNKSKFLSLTPGLTGYWQVNGRSNTTYEERMKMELYYVDNISFLLDLKIFFKTFKAIAKKDGAM